jgi:hypothetical protein
MGIEYKTPMQNWQMYYTVNINGVLYSLCSDLADSSTIYTVFMSDDGGKNWTKHFTFDVQKDNIIRVQPLEFSCIGNTMYAKLYSVQGQAYFKIDLANKTAKRVLTVNADGGWKIFNVKNRYYAGNYSFPGGSKIITNMLYTENINQDSVVWKPLNTGRYSMPFISKFNSDSMFCFSAVDTVTHGGGYYLARAKNITSVVEEPEVEANQPLYISAPVPLPANNETRMKVY